MMGRASGASNGNLVMLFVYAVIACAVSFYLIYLNLPTALETGVNEQMLIILAVSGGVLLGSVRVVIELVNDATKKRFKPEYTLMFIWRPIEAAMVTLFVYFIGRGGILLFDFQVKTTSGLTIVVISAIGGGFAHITMKRLYKKINPNAN